MSLLGTAALLGTAWAMYEGGKIRDQEAYPKINDKEFDKECAEHGIMYKMDDEKIRKFAARLGIRYKDRKYKILPDIKRNADYRIKMYLEGYALNNSEINEFYNYWNNYNDRMKKEKQEGIRKQNEWQYKAYERVYIKKEYVSEDEKEMYEEKVFPRMSKEVIEIVHWQDIGHDEAIKRMNKIYNETWIKQFVIKEPILRRRYNGWHETWIIKAEDEKDAKTMYKACCKHCGWNPEI